MTGPEHAALFEGPSRCGTYEGSRSGTNTLRRTRDRAAAVYEGSGSGWLVPSTLRHMRDQAAPAYEGLRLGPSMPRCLRDQATAAYEGSAIIRDWSDLHETISSVQYLAQQQPGTHEGRGGEEEDGGGVQEQEQ